MLVYLKSASFDFLLCVAASCALAFTAMSGFYSTQPYQSVTGILITIGVSIILTAAMFLVAINRRFIVVGGIVFALVVIGVFAAAVAMSNVDNPMDDIVGNYLYLSLCLVLPPLITFGLSRSRPGCLILIAIGVLFCGVIEYLYWYGHLAAFLVFLVAAVSLYVYRTYQVSLLNSESESLAFASVTGVGVVLSLVAVGIGLGLFASIVAPLEPPNLVIKLVTEHYRAEEKEVRGIGSTDDVQNEEQSTEQNDEISQSSEMEEEDDSQDNGDASGIGSLFASLAAGLAGLTMNFPKWWPIAAVVGLVAMVIAAIALKKLLRRRRYDRMVSAGGNEAASALYLFFLNRFKRFKIPQPGTLTLQEYAEGYSELFKKFEQKVDDSSFAALTRVYSRQVYGGDGVSEEELELFKDYYSQFYKRACRYMGRLKYCRMFFRI